MEAESNNQAAPSSPGPSRRLVPPSQRRFRCSRCRAWRERPWFERYKPKDPQNLGGDGMRIWKTCNRCMWQKSDMDPADWVEMHCVWLFDGYCPCHYGEFGDHRWGFCENNFQTTRKSDESTEQEATAGGEEASGGTEEIQSAESLLQDTTAGGPANGDAEQAQGADIRPQEETDQQMAEGENEQKINGQVQTFFAADGHARDQQLTNNQTQMSLAAEDYYENQQEVQVFADGYVEHQCQPQ